MLLSELAVRSSKKAISSPALRPGTPPIPEPPGSVDERECGDAVEVVPSRLISASGVGFAGRITAPAGEKVWEVGLVDGPSVLSEIVLNILKSRSMVVGGSGPGVYELGGCGRDHCVSASSVSSNSLSRSLRAASTSVASPSSSS